jgi:hypothetical protein
VGPGSAPTTGTWLENDAMKLRRGTKGILQTFQWMGCRFQCRNNETIAYIPTALKAVNVNFIADVAVKTKGKLNAVAPATSGVSADVSAIVTSESTLLSWKRSWNASLGLDGLLDSSIKNTNMLKTPFFDGCFILV